MVHAPSSSLARRFGGLATALALAVAIASCATTGAGSMRSARDAEAAQNYDLAVAEYTKLLRANPNDANARQGLERAKLRASQDHFTAARRHAATGKLEEALVEYQLASELNPANGDIEKEMQATRVQLRTKVALSAKTARRSSSR